MSSPAWLNSIEQSAMRSEFFATTHDRTQHEHQLEADCSRRLASDDWDY